MKGYETVFITHPDIEEDNLAKLLKKFKRVIKKGQSELVHENLWGRRRLAYPIANQKYGVYHIWYLTGNGEMLEELHKQFRFSDEIIRFQTVTAEDLDEEARYFSEILKIQEEENATHAVTTSLVKPKKPEKNPEQIETNQKKEETMDKESESEKQTEDETSTKETEKVASQTETTET